ncbi:MAG: hypothetical protein ACTSSN_03110 [Candidatus Heimdallarchaeaceae archaeon]
MFLEIISGIFSISAGTITALLWFIVLLRKQGIQFIEHPFERLFHIAAELIMSILAIVGGIALILQLTWGLYLFLFAMGLILYAIVNAIGIYGKKKYKMLLIVLVISAVLTFVLVIIDFVFLVFLA